MGKSFMFAFENSGDGKLDLFPTIQEQINSGRQIVNETPAHFLFNVTPPDSSSDFKYVSEDSYKTLLNEEYNEIYSLLKYGSNTLEVLAENVTNLNLEEDDQLFDLHNAGVQTDKLAWMSTDEEYGNIDLSIPNDVVIKNLEKSKSYEELVAKEINENQTKIDLVKTSLDILGDYDDDAFWSVIETGIGTAMDFSESVEFVKNWIKQNGTWEDNLQVLGTECDNPNTVARSDRCLTFKKDLSQELATEEVESRPTNIDIVASTFDTNSLHALNNEITVNYTIIKNIKKANFDNLKGVTRKAHNAHQRCERKVYFYAVDDINGTVEGLAPTDSGYAQAALNKIIFPKFSESDNNTEIGSLQVDTGSLIVPLVIEGETLTEAQNGNAKVYFSYAGASGGDGLDHINLLDGYVFGFKELLDNTDNDFNDIVIKLDNFSI